MRWFALSSYRHADPWISAFWPEEHGSSLGLQLCILPILAKLHGLSFSVFCQTVEPDWWLTVPVTYGATCRLQIHLFFVQ
jgi:hypothetical protein